MTPHLTPTYIWSRIKYWLISRINTHPWVCPVYILKTHLWERCKLTKWYPWSQRGHYMGASHLHASTVGLVRSFTTNLLSPKFHAVYNDFFKTVHS